ncbi:MAG: cell surface protein [Burkholderiales bacterium]|nr:cell surface protein [Burkholderiales bacterium]
MKKTLVAQTVAAAISGLALVGVADAAVVGPYTDASATVVDETVAETNARTGAAPATVLRVNTDGIGHILVVPYYSVQNGNDTYINIVNSDMRNGKAVKVRFRGASNSDDVFDFTLLMSPGDVFAFAVTKGADGLPKVAHGDNSCTLPNNIKQSFVTTRLNPSLTAAQKAEQASEGYVEILNMADIPPTVEYDPSDPTTATLFNMIKHVNGTPRSCTGAAFTRLASDPTGFTGDPAVAPPGATAHVGTARHKGLDVPTTGLMANWTIINVPRSSTYTGAATAVEARTAAGAAGYGNVVFSPQAATGVTAVNARAWTTDPLLRGGVASNSVVDNTGDRLVPGTPAVTAAQYDFPDLSTPYLNADIAPATGRLPTTNNGLETKTQAFLLTQALALNSISNEFNTEAGLAAKTDWVFSMPTRRYNVARNYAGGTPAGTGANVYTDLRNRDSVAAVVAPVAIAGQSNYFEPFETGVGGNILTTNGQICVTGISVAGGDLTGAPGNLSHLRAAVTADREERFVATSTDFVISPGEPAAPLTFCGEASVLSFNAAGAASVLGATVARKDLTVAYENGWVRLATPGLGGKGLPITGAAMSLLNNGAALPGVSATYGQTFPHRATRP